MKEHMKHIGDIQTKKILLAVIIVGSLTVGIPMMIYFLGYVNNDNAENGWWVFIVVPFVYVFLVFGMIWWQKQEK